MARFLNRGDAIWGWAVRRYAGEDLGFSVYWNADDPAPGYQSDHQWFTHESQAFVRIRAIAGDRAFETQWRLLAYEFYNLENSSEFERVYQEAVAGKVGRSNWIARNTRLEYEALLKTVRFFDVAWGPWARKTGAPATRHMWAVPARYRDWIDSYANPDEYPESFWGRYYDVHILPQWAHRHRTR